MSPQLALLELARLCEHFPHARLADAMLADGRFLRCVADAPLARCFGHQWVQLSGADAATACCLAAAVFEARDLPPFA